MKTLLLILSTVFLIGCATSTIESRKQERYTAYSSLEPEVRTLVDQGQIKVGMPMDAVYIAWGTPSQMLGGESEKGMLATWIYAGTDWVEHRYWSYRSYRYGNRIYSEPYLETDYQPHSYVSAEVVFENGLVKTWRSLHRR